MPILRNVPRIKSPADIPPLGKGRQAGPEDYLWRELIAAWAGFDYGSQAWRQRAGNVQALAGQGSPNHAQLSFAVWYLLAPEERVGGRTAREFWRALARWQLGVESPPAAGVAGFLECSEPGSNDYQGYSVGSWLAVLDRALRDDPETAAELQPLIRTWAAVTTLFSVRPASSILLHGLGGDVGIRNPSRTLARLPVGARSTAQHLHADPGALILTDLIGYPGDHPQPSRDPLEFWYLMISSARRDWLKPEDAAAMRAAIDGGFGALDCVATMIPATTKWVGRLESWRWADRALGIVPRCLNGNTSWNPLAIAHRNGVLEIWNPWPKPKCPGLGEGRAEVRDGAAMCWSGYGKLPSALLPGEPPLRRYIFDQDGMHVEAGGDAVAVIHQPDAALPTPTDPTAPAADLSRVRAIVEGLRLGNHDRQNRARALDALSRNDPRAALDAVRAFGIGPGQAQAVAWREAIAMLEGALT